MTDKPDRQNNHHPGQDDDPKEVGREAEELSPNQDAHNDRENIVEDEIGVPGQDQLDTSRKQSRPLDRPEDNARVDQVVPDEPEQVAAPTPRSYVMSPRVLRNLFIASNVAGVLIIVVILTLASSAPQGRLAPADETQYQRTLLEATDTINTTAQNQGGQTARIPISDAITLVAKEGLGPVTQALAAPPTTPAATTPSPTPAEAAAPAPAKPANAAAGPAGGATAQKNAAQAQAAGAQPAGTQQSNQQGNQQNTQPSNQQSSAPAAAPAALDLSAGESVFTTNCASCHQTTGLGIAGAFPPLKGHVPTLYNADRGYLIDLLLYGLQGEAQIEGQTYNGVMPAWQQLSDDDIANVLNYVTHAWDNADALQNFKSYEAAEVESARGDSLSSDQVYALRQKLGLTGEN